MNRFILIGINDKLWWVMVGYLNKLIPCGCRDMMGYFEYGGLKTLYYYIYFLFYNFTFKKKSSHTMHIPCGCML